MRIKLKNIFLMMVALFTLNMCTFIPEPPYDLPTGTLDVDSTNNDEEPKDSIITDAPDLPSGTYIDEKFVNGFGIFTVYTVGDYSWQPDYGCVRVSGYDNPSKVNYATESWLISSPLDFTEESEAYIEFDYLIRDNEPGKVAERNQLLMSSNYAGDVTAAEWKVINYNPQESTDLVSFRSSGKIAVPAEFIGKLNVTIAFKYTSTNSSAGTWMLKNLVVAHGAGDAVELPEAPDEPTVPETPDNPDIPNQPNIPEGENLIPNGGFEEWNDNKPIAWCELPEYSNATVEQSGEAKEGAVSLLIKAGSKNQRLASKIYTLGAGTYSFVVYVKAPTDNYGSCRLGYAFVTDENPELSYTYDEPFAVTGEWLPVVYEFEITEEDANKEIVLVIMNRKPMNEESASFLVDDVRLIKH